MEYKNCTANMRHSHIFGGIAAARHKQRLVMVKKLIQHGNSAALVIDKPIMEILNITNETTFELSTDGRNLILSPQTEHTQEKDILNSLEKINKKYGAVLKRLGG
jgi:antitoxin component of MazEF toxin-antitoxin module